MKFSDNAWELWSQKFPGADREAVEQQMAADLAVFHQKANGDEEKMMGLLALETISDLSALLHLPQSFVMRTFLNQATKKSRARLKQAIRRARGGH